MITNTIEASVRGNETSSTCFWIHPSKACCLCPCLQGMHLRVHLKTRNKKWWCRWGREEAGKKEEKGVEPENQDKTDQRRTQITRQETTITAANAIVINGLDYNNDRSCDSLVSSAFIHHSFNLSRDFKYKGKPGDKHYITKHKIQSQSMIKRYRMGDLLRLVRLILLKRETKKLKIKMSDKCWSSTTTRTKDKMLHTNLSRNEFVVGLTRRKKCHTNSDLQGKCGVSFQVITCGMTFTGHSITLNKHILTVRWPGQEDKHREDISGEKKWIHSFHA